MMLFMISLTTLLFPDNLSGCNSVVIDDARVLNAQQLKEITDQANQITDAKIRIRTTILMNAPNIDVYVQRQIRHCDWKQQNLIFIAVATKANRSAIYIGQIFNPYLIKIHDLELNELSPRFTQRKYAEGLLFALSSLQELLNKKAVTKHHNLNSLNKSDKLLVWAKDPLNPNEQGQPVNYFLMCTILTILALSLVFVLWITYRDPVSDIKNETKSLEQQTKEFFESLTEEQAKEDWFSEPFDNSAPSQKTAVDVIEKIETQQDELQTKVEGKQPWS